MSNETVAPNIDATERNNDLSFKGVMSANFSLKDHSITSGQPFDGVENLGGGTIRVLAGRKESKSVADWFNSQPSGAKLPTHTELKSPTELNFAIRGTLTLNDGGGPITCQDVVIAQGSYGTTNYWWITAPGMTESDSDVRYLGKAGFMVGVQNGRRVQVHFVTESADLSDVHTMIVKTVQTDENEDVDSWLRNRSPV